MAVINDPCLFVNMFQSPILVVLINNSFFTGKINSLRFLWVKLEGFRSTKEVYCSNITLSNVVAAYVQTFQLIYCNLWHHKLFVQHFRGLSFPTISSVGPNSAIIHYEPEASTCSELDADKIYLCDSGAQVENIPLLNCNFLFLRKLNGHFI
jgi:hypothetical protein